MMSDRFSTDSSRKELNEQAVWISSKSSLRRMTPLKVRSDGLKNAIGQGRNPKLLEINTVLG